MNNKEENVLENVEEIENQNPNISFEKAVLIIGVQILPQSESSLDRSVILSTGIKGEPPLLSSCTLTELLTGIPIQSTLQKLEETLPEMIETSRNRKKAKQQEIKNISERIHTPQSSPENHPNKSTQLTLF
ncbi:hypothetical protein [Aerosakkonema funiforme]|uniref:hypothetical protein n=1 Tax=Aerosakkonema funiforme TaxID=1246630 RepID=UPI0035BA5091